MAEESKPLFRVGFSLSRALEIEMHVVRFEIFRKTELVP